MGCPVLACHALSWEMNRSSGLGSHSLLVSHTNPLLNHGKPHSFGDPKHFTLRLVQQLLAALRSTRPSYYPFELC